MGKKIKLLDFAPGIEGSVLEPVRLTETETAVIFFTEDGEEVELHYCSDPDINSYIKCNGDGCILCRIVKKKEIRRLFPVYLPASGKIGILAVSTSQRPYALYPQIVNVFKSDKRMVLFITRENNKYIVSTNEITEDMDWGEKEIAEFLEGYNNGDYHLSSIYSKIENEQLEKFPEIFRMLQLKGLK